MEHILQFAVNIDDDAIKKIVIEKASKDVAKEIKENLWHTYNTGYGFSGYSDLAEKCMNQVLVEHKDEIINRVANSLYESLRRTKKYKDALNAAEEKADA